MLRLALELPYEKSSLTFGALIYEDKKTFHKTAVTYLSIKDPVRVEPHRG